MRTEAQLKEILEEAKKGFATEFGVPYHADRLHCFLGDLLQKKFEHFVFKRFSHLPAVDLIGFLKVVVADRDAPVVEEQPPQVSDNKSQSGKKKK